MGEAITDLGRQTATGSAVPALERGTGATYDPEAEAYAGDPNRIEDAHKAFNSFAREAAEEKIALTVSAVTPGGLRETVSLSAKETHDYLTRESVEARRRFLGKRIRERRARVAAEGATLLRAGKSLNELHPDQEAALREFGAIVEVENDGVRSETLREDLWGTPDLANTIATPYLDQEWLPYGQGPLGYQLYLADMWEQLAKAWWAWHHDPLAKRGVNLMAAYVVGRGVQIRCEDEESQRVVDEFWKRERMDRRLRTWTADLGRDGELFARDMPLESDMSKTKVRSLDPTTIWEIITDAEDIEMVYSYVQRYMTRTQLFAPPDGSPAQKWIEREFTPDELIHVRVNASSSEVRGRSDAYVVLGMMKRLRDYLTSEVLKSQAQAAWHRDIKIDGSDADVKAFASAQQSQGAPQPGEDWFHNSAVDISLIASQNRSPAGNGSLYTALVNLIAVGFGLSKEDFGVAEHASLASAEETGQPSEFSVDDRQQLMRDFLERLLHRVLKRAQRGGRLSPNADLRTEVIMPEVRREEFEKRLNALALGVAMDWWSAETSASVASSEVGLHRYDFNDEQEKIADERARKMMIARQFEQVPRSIDQAVLAPGDVVNPGPSAQTQPKETATRERGVFLVS